MRQGNSSRKNAVAHPDVNVKITHTSPVNAGELEHYHWHVEIIPRLTRVAGFEWGTGFYINPVPPESAAEFLREVDTGAAAGPPAEKK